MRNALFPLLLLIPSDSWSCATCFGGETEGMLNGLLIGGVVLLVCVFSILATIVSYIRRTERKKAQIFAKMGLMDEGEGSEERWPL
ncbi:MAG: hypothetical protein COB53_10970 [Elusimicrobia bacterium]|nr:MAG: hypothetical protein COB53_10970 [Elusimicrobiota bacterium]